MSEKTVKLEGYVKIGPPPENAETQWWRQWLAEIIFGLYHEKKKVLAEHGWPPKPIHQREIFREKCRRIAMLKDAELWGRTSQFPYTKDHGHNWIEKRVNEVASEAKGPKTKAGLVKIVNVTGGFYMPNPKLFGRKL